MASKHRPTWNKPSAATPAARRKRQHHKSMESLESRLLLATDFVYNQANAVAGFTGRLINTANDLQLVDTANNTVLHAVPLLDFSGEVRITGSPAVDSVTFDVNLTNVLKNVEFDGGDGEDRAIVASNLSLPSFDLSLSAETITVQSGVTISTLPLVEGAAINGSPGDITLVGKNITLETGAKLLAGVSPNSNLAAGDITLHVVDRPSAALSIAGDILSPVLVAERVATISMVGAELDGGTITIDATAATQTRWDDVGEYMDDIADQMLDTLGSITDLAISLISPISGQVKIQKATGNIALTDTTVRGQGAVTITATSESDAGFRTVGINSIVPVGGAPLPFIVNVGYGETLAKANIDLAGTTNITAGADVAITTEVASDARVRSKAAGNTRLSDSDSVDVGISLAIALTNEESTISMDAAARIESQLGSVDIHALGEGDTEAEGEAILFQDGIAGLAVGVAVDRATVTADIHGTIIAANPQGSSAYTFDAAQVVDVAANAITINGIPADQEIVRGQELIYRAGSQAPIGGLVDGQTYVVADVEHVPAGGGFTGSQRVTLASTLPLPLDATQVLPQSVHTLGQLTLTTFRSDAVAPDGSNRLSIALPGINTGDELTYVGPNSPVTEYNITATFQRDAGGDRVTRTDDGTDWEALGLHIGQVIQFTEAGPNSGAYTIQGFSPDGATLILVQANQVTNGPVTGFYLQTDASVTINGIAATFQRNANGDTITRTDGGQDWQLYGLAVGQTFELTNAGANSGTWTIQGFSPDGSGLILVEANRVVAGNLNGLTLQSDPTTSTGIGNLVQGTTYEVVVTAGRVTFRDPANPANFIPFASPGLGIQGFSHIKNLQSFQPAAAVDGARDTIALTAHGFQTGDLLIYHTDPTQRLVRSVFSFSKTAPNDPVPFGTTSLPDAPIDGMENGFAYYVTRVDADHIRLSESSVAARKAAVIDLTTTSTGTHEFAGPTDSVGIDILAKLEVKNFASAGVELSDAEQPWSDVLLSNPQDATNILAGLVRSQNLISDMRKQVQTKFGRQPFYGPQPEPPQDSGVPLEFAGTFAVSVYEHIVEARVGSSAVLKSGKDIQVLAEIEQASSTNSISEATRNGLDAADASDTGAAREDIEIAVAFSITVNQNTARAVVEENAILDARGTLTVASTVSYPFLIDSAEAALNPAIAIKEEGLDGLAFLLDGTLGFGTFLFNSWVSAVGGDPGSNSADKFVIGAGIGLNFFDNESTAVIGAAAAINQDPAYRTVNQAVNVHANTLLQSVDVAHISSFNLSVPGILDSGLGALESGNIAGFFQGIVNPFGVSGKSAIGPSVLYTSSQNDTIAEVQTGLRLPVTPANITGNAILLSSPLNLRTGTQVVYELAPGDAPIAGLVPGQLYYLIPDPSNPLRVQLADSLVNALGNVPLPISATGTSGVGHVLVARTLVHTGSSGTGLSVEATQEILSVAVSQTGARASDFGLSAAVTVGAYTSVTRANIGTDVTITGGAVTVRADDSVDRYAIDGGFVLGEKVGVGVAVGVNVMDRTTLAYIGSDTPSSDAIRGLGPRQIDISGELSVTAHDRGNIFALGIAAAILTSPDQTPTPGQPAIPTDGGNAVGGITVALGASVSVNEGTSVVRAFIDDPVVRAATVTVSASSDIVNRAIVVGGAASVTEGTVNIAGAGAFAVNDLKNRIEAYIRDADVIALGAHNSDGVQVTATDNSTIYADGGGVALVVSRGKAAAANISVGISVAVNEIESNVFAFIDASPITSQGNVSVVADLTPTIDALTIGGSGAVSTGGTGSALNISGAGAGAKNVILGRADAYIVDVSAANNAGIVVTGGDLLVSATDNSNIVADAGAFALSLALSASGQFVNLSFAISVAINEITNTVNAYIEDSTLNIGGDITVSGTSNATIDALTIGGAVASGAFSGAGSGNFVKNSNNAYILGGIGANNAPAIVATGIIDVLAQDGSTIIADAGGFAIALTLSQQSGGLAATGSIGIGAAVNEITNTAIARIQDTTVSAGIAVHVMATSVAVIDALTMGGAGAATVATGSAFTFAGAGAGSGNKIANTVTAFIADRNASDGPTEVTAATGAVSVLANDTSIITADSGALAIVLGISQGNANINISVGISIAINSVTNSVQAFVEDATIDAAGNVAVEAISSATILALTVAGAAAIGIAPSGSNGYGVTFAGAGAGSGNLIDGLTQAYISRESVVNAGDGDTLSVAANDTSVIRAKAIAGSLSLQTQSGGTVSIGVAIAKNTIDADVLAYIDKSTATVGGDLVVFATSTSTVEALTVGVAASLTINPGQGVTLSGSGAGAQSTNTITNTIDSSIRQGSTVTTTQGGNVSLLAQDRSTVIADSGGGSLAVSASPQGFNGALAISAGLSYNKINNSIQSYIQHTNTVVTADGDVSVKADSLATIDALAVSVAAAVAVTDPQQGFGLAMAGGGAESNNEVANLIRAMVADGATVNAAGNVSILAVDVSTIQAEVPAVAFTLSVGVGLSIGVTLSNNTITNDVDARVENATLNAATGNIQIDASSQGTIEALATPVALSISIGAAGQGGKAIAAIGGRTEASIGGQSTLSAPLGDVVISSTADKSTNAETKGGGAGLINIGVMLAESTISADTRAYIEGVSTITTQDVRVVTYGTDAGEPSTTERIAKSKVVTGAVAILGGNGGKAHSEISGTVEAYVGSNVAINASGEIQIDANSDSTVMADAPGGAGGGITVTALLADALLSGDTSAYVRPGAQLNAAALDVRATADSTLDARILVAGVSLAGGVGGKATAKDSSHTEAYIGRASTSAVILGPNISISGDVNVVASKPESITTDARGGAGGGISAGAFVATAESTGNTTAYLDREASVAAGNLLVHALVPSRTLTSTQVGATVAVIGVTVLGADVSVTGDVTASIGNGAVVSTPFGTTTILAESQGTGSASAEGGSGGIVNVASFTADTSIGESSDLASTTAFIGDGAEVTTRDLNVRAGATRSATSDLLAVSVAGVAVAVAAANATTYGNTKAYIGVIDRTVINASGAIVIDAKSSQFANADATAGGGGVGAVSVANGVATVSGATDAYMSDKTVVPNTTSLSITTDIVGSSATAKMLAGTGGGISVGSTKATAKNDPTTSAYIGDASVINVVGDLLVSAVGRGEADAKSESSGGGVVQVGVAYAKATNNPSVDAHIAPKSLVTVGGNLNVNAEFKKEATAPQPSDRIENLPGEADGTAVDVAQDTLDFAFPVQTGTEVVYDTQDGCLTCAITPLEDGRLYNVIVVDPNRKIQLGNLLNATGVDEARDILRFDVPHNFLPGDAVIYDARGGLSIIEPWQTSLPANDPLFVNPAQVLYVRGVYTDPADTSTYDRRAIRLARTPGDATANDNTFLRALPESSLNFTTNVISSPGHAFVNGQSVTYRASVAENFSTEAADATVVDFVFNDSNGVQQTVKDVQRDSFGVVVHTNNNRIFVPNHGFNTGDALLYRSAGVALGGLTDGVTYYAIRIDANQIQLASSYFEAVGRAFDGRGTADTSDDIAAINVTPINLTPTGDPGASHRLSRNWANVEDGLTYYVVNATATTFQLAATRGGAPIDLDTGDTIQVLQNNNVVANTIHPITRGGTHRLGTLGIDLRAGTGTQSLRFDLLADAPASEHRLLGPGQVTLASIAPPPGDGASSATAQGGSGGGIDVGVPSGELNSTVTVNAYVRADRITAGGNVGILSKAFTDSSTYADTQGGGVVSIGEAHADTNVGANVKSRVFPNVVIVAGGNFSMNAESDHTVAATGVSKGGGGISGKIAETTANLLGNTTSEVHEDAQITAEGLLSIRTNANSTGRSSSDTFVIAVGAGADSDDTNGDRGVTLTTPSSVIISPGAKLDGGTVDLLAATGRIEGKAHARAEAYSPIFIGYTQAFADASVNVNAPTTVSIINNSVVESQRTKITGEFGVDIRATTANPDVVRDAYALAISTIPPQGTELLGTTTAGSAVQADDGALVVAGTRDATSPLFQATGRAPELALYVSANGVAWDADVTLLSSNPELVVDSNGVITKEKHLDADLVPSFPGGPIERVVLQNLVNRGPGQVLFDSGVVIGSRSLFTFEQTFKHVDIQVDQLDLFINDIQVYADPTVGIQPKVLFYGALNGLEFDVAHAFNPTEIVINNDDDTIDGFGVFMSGLIDNPIGTTRISARSNVLSASFRGRQGVVRTNRLEITAGFDAGRSEAFEGEGTRIPIDIVESDGRRAHMSVVAGEDIYVGIQGLKRSSDVGEFITTTDLQPSLFDAGELADILLLGGLDQRTVTNGPIFGIQVFENVIFPVVAPAPTSPSSGPRTTPVIDHFRVSKATAVALPPDVFGNGTTPIPVTYDLGLVEAGVAIDIYKDDPVTSRVNIISDTNIVTGPAQVNIDSRTNGFIQLTEFPGDMRIGAVVSSDDHVTLNAVSGSIVDVPDNLAANGDPEPDAVGVNVVLRAFNGGVGTATNPFDIDSSNVRAGEVVAVTRDDIELIETAGNLNVSQLSSSDHDVTALVVAGAFVDARLNFPFVPADVVGGVITLIAQNAPPFGDAIGTAADPLEIDSSRIAKGGLITRTNANVTITEVRNELYVQEVSTAENITVRLSVLDSGSNRNDLIVEGPIDVFAGTVSLTAGDDFSLSTANPQASIRATSGIDIFIDPPIGDPDPFGGTAHLGKLVDGSVTIQGGDDIDLFEVVPQGRPMEIFGGQPVYPTFPGDRLDVDEQGQSSVDTVLDITQGRGFVETVGAARIDYFSIEMVDRIDIPDGPVNDPPINRLPAPINTDQIPVVLSLANGNALSVTDVDAGAATDFTVSLTVGTGTVSLTNASGVAVTGTGAVGTPLVLTGTLSNINIVLGRGVILNLPNGFTGPTTLTMVSNDQGNTGSGGPLTDTDTLNITIAVAVNDPPVNQLPAPITTALTTLILSSANGNALSVTDIDAGNAANFEVALSLDVGTLQIVNSVGVTVVGNGTPGLPLVLTGTITNINAALASGLQVVMPDGFLGSNTLTMVSNDRGNTGAGGELTDTDVLAIKVIEINDPPVNHLPAPIVTNHTPITFSLVNSNALSVTDVDERGATDFQVSLHVTQGSLALAKSFNVVSTGLGTVGSPLTIVGSLANINTVLGVGLVFTPPVGFLGTSTLTMVSNDQGNTGVGGPLTDTDALDITITADVNDPPVNHHPLSLVTNLTVVEFSSALGNRLSVTDIDAGEATNFSVRLSVSNGSLALVTGAGVIVSGNGSLASPLNLVGSIANINTVLSVGLRFTPPIGFLGTTTLTMVSNDAGNTGLGGPLSDTDTFTITTVGDVNDPPINSLPAAIVTDESPIVLSVANGNALSVADVDAGNAANFVVTLTIQDGTLALAPAPALVVAGDGRPSSPLVVTGRMADINAALATSLTVTPPIGFQGSTVLTMVSNDNGNTGAGGPMTDTDHLLITLAGGFDEPPVNDPPVNHLPNAIITEPVPVVFSAANGNALSVTDVDAGNAADFQVVITVPNGTLQLSNTAGLAVTGNGSAIAPLRLVGTLSDINLALASGLTFVPTVGFLGTTLLTIVSNDAGNTGSGGPLSDTDTMTITVVTDVNDPPVNRLPNPITTNTVPIVLSLAAGTALSVADDADPNANNFEISLQFADGTLALASTAGITATGLGTPASPLVLTGTLPSLNAALANGLQVIPTVGFVGATSLTMTSNDRGNTGIGGPLTDTDTLPIMILADDVNDPPVNHLPSPIVTSTVPVVLSSVNGNRLSVTDPDVGNGSLAVTLSVSEGTLSLATVAGLVATGNGSVANPLRIVGKLLNINTALAAGLTYFPTPGFFGSTTLTMVSDDLGNSGTGGPLTDTDTLNITIVTDVNDPPVNTLPPAIVTDQVTFTLSNANGNGLSVADIDAGSAANFQVSFTIGNGTLSLVNSAGLTVTGNGANATPLQLVGTLSNINAALATGLVVTENVGLVGNTVLTMVSNDNGNTGTGGPLTDTDLLSITIVGDVNDPPVNHLPANVTIDPIPLIFSDANGNKLSVSDIDAGNANNFTVTLTAPDGSLILLNPINVAASGTGTLASPLILVGALADINASLAAGLRYLSDIGFEGVTTLTIVSNDQGNTGAGGPLTDSDAVLITVNGVNNPPVNRLPAPIVTDQVPVVLSGQNGNALQVNDVDAGNALDFEIVLTIADGTLQLTNPAGVTVTGNGTPGAPLRLIGRLPDLNDVLDAGLTVNPPIGFVGPTTLTVFSNDHGNTGFGGSLTDTDTLSITIEARNQGPVNHLPAPITTDQLPIVLSVANGNAISVTDIDAGNANNFTVVLTLANGTLNLTNPAGISATGLGNATTPLTLVGTLADINAALAAGVVVVPTPGFFATTTLTVFSNDNGNTGTGGPLTDTDLLPITILARNQGPINILPAPVTTDKTVVVLSQFLGNELAVTDADAGNAPNFSVSLSVPTGSLSLVNAAGVSVTGTGTPGSPLVLQGTLAAINGSLANGLQVNLPVGFVGTIGLTMVSNDNGNTGTGGALTDTDTLDITILPRNQGPINHLPPAITSGQVPVVLSTANGNALSVIDVDAGTAVNFVVSLSVSVGTISLVNSAGVSVNGNGTSATPLLLTGTLSAINSVLGTGVRVTTPNGFLGTTTLTMISNDNGNTGTGGALTDTDTLPITIVALPPGPRVVSVIADSANWTSAFRDFVDGGFTDASAAGYRIPQGPLQLETLPWVNIDRLKVVFNTDVESSIDDADFSVTAAPGFTALGIPPRTIPGILDVTYDRATLTATVIFNDLLPAAVLDLKISAAGVFDQNLNSLDGEWENGVQLGNSGDGNAGGDFSFRLFVLPGDLRDESGGNGTRTVNSNDSQLVRDLQNGVALPNLGVFGYDQRADVDGNSFVNSTDSQFVRDQQNAIIFRNPGNAPVAPQLKQDLNADGSVDAADIELLFANWGNSGLGDLNDDGIVDAADVQSVFGEWTGDTVTLITRKSVLSSDAVDKALFENDTI